jgi:hypothetical protein
MELKAVVSFGREGKSLARDSTVRVRQVLSLGSIGMVPGERCDD